MHKSNTQIIYVATEEELLRESYYRRLWLAVKNIKISRRKWLEELADTFRDYDGVFLYHNGRDYILPCLDKTFGHDADMRWFGYYLMADETGKHPRSKSSRRVRLRVLDLYFRVKYPHIAEKFQ